MVVKGTCVLNHAYTNICANLNSLTFICPYESCPFIFNIEKNILSSSFFPLLFLLYLVIEVTLGKDRVEHNIFFRMKLL